jgi:hypothetical protein
MTEGRHWINHPNAAGLRLITFQISKIEYNRVLLTRSPRDARTALSSHFVETVFDQAEHPFREFRLSR